MANDLDELNGPINQQGRDVNVIEKQLKEGISKKLVGLKMLDKAIARHGYEVYLNEEKIGLITSGGVSPTRGDNIALAYIKNIENLTIGSTIQVLIRDKFYNAEIIKKPFIEKRNKEKI